MLKLFLILIGFIFTSCLGSAADNNVIKPEISSEHAHEKFIKLYYVSEELKAACRAGDVEYIKTTFTGHRELIKSDRDCMFSIINAIFLDDYTFFSPLPLKSEIERVNILKSIEYLFSLNISDFIDKDQYYRIVTGVPKSIRSSCLKSNHLFNLSEHELLSLLKIAYASQDEEIDNLVFGNEDLANKISQKSLLELFKSIESFADDIIERLLLRTDFDQVDTEVIFKKYESCWYSSLKEKPTIHILIWDILETRRLNLSMIESILRNFDFMLRYCRHIYEENEIMWCRLLSKIINHESVPSSLEPNIYIWTNILKINEIFQERKQRLSSI